ncbi:MAG: glycosyltransferase family 2 protein [Deltaproteobacteria bacterium]|nr:glycosyltransferase family 2 protein [Deltaproteobacteria bacterium]
MSPNAVVSIVVPAYNRRGLIRQTLDSVRAQRYRPLELVVVDDGSTDGTADFVEEWSWSVAPDVRTILLRQANQGASAARNAGIEASTGDFLQFLDSDDLLAPDKLAVDLDLLAAHPAAPYTWCRTVQLGGSRRHHTYLGGPIRALPHDVPKHNWHISGLLVRSAAVKRSGGFATDCRRSGDWEFAARLKFRCGYGVFHPRVGSSYRIHQDEQLTKGPLNQYLDARERALLHIVRLIDELPSADLGGRAARDQLCLEMIRCALGYLRIGNLRAGTRCLSQAESIMPRGAPAERLHRLSKVALTKLFD